MSESHDLSLQPTAVLVCCPQCGELYQSTSVGCSRCTAELESPLIPTTQQIDRLPTAIPLLASQLDTLNPTCQVLLQFLPSGLCIPVYLDKPVILGRYTTQRLMAADNLVDLSHLGAEKHGVSRRHCQLERQGAHLFIIDLASTNGSYLNGARLTAYMPYRLADGDRLILSTLHFTISFVSSAAS